MPELINQIPHHPHRSALAGPIRRQRSEELPAFACLRAPLRGRLEISLTQGAGLGLLWVNLAAFPLFVRLYGEQLAGEVAQAVESLLRQIMPQLLNPQRLQIIERVDPSSFMILFANGNRDQAHLLDLGLRLRLALRTQLGPTAVQLTGQDLMVDVGCAWLPAEPGRGLETLLYNALCDARQVAAGELDYDKLGLMQAFRRVVETPLLSAVYQPIVDLRTGDTLGWEALARGPVGDHFHSPGLLFDFAEEVGALFGLERACREQALAGLGGLMPGQKIFLNIHPQTMGAPDFRSGETRRLLDGCGLRPHNVVFEITERHSIKDFTLFHRTLEHYRSQGYLVAIDDVGTGYSGLSSIAKVRPDYIKVDMGLIHGIDANPVQRALVETLVTFADKIGCAIVAEGIETETELTSLVAMGVHYGQGFFLARPAAPKPLPRTNLPLKRSIRGGAKKEWACSIPVRELVEPAHQVSTEARTREVKQMLDSQPISGLVVVDRGKPVGLVMSHALDRQLGTYYGTALYWERSVSRVMDAAPLIVEGSAPVEQVAKTAMNRDRFKLYDHIIVTEEGYLAGIVSVQKMLDALARVQVEMARGMSPLTGLPGNVALEQEIESRCSGANSAAFVYVDLDHFKVYNDTYGFEAGDKVILLMGRILVWALRRHGGPDAFVGHVGGDDFVLITTPERAERVCQAVVRCFARLVPHCYSPEDRQRGYVQGKDRNGNPGRFPLISVSMAIVDCLGRCDLGQISQRAAEVKRYAKSLPGNVHVRDRRLPLGDQAPVSCPAPTPDANPR